MQNFFYTQGTPVVHGHGQVMSGPPNMTYGFATPPHGQAQMSTPNHTANYRSPQQYSPQVLCPTTPTVDCWGWMGGGQGTQPVQVAVNAATSTIPMPSVISFDQILKQELKDFEGACTAVGGPVGQLAKHVSAVWKEQRAMIDKAIKMKRPSYDNMAEILAPTEKALMKVESAAGELADEHPDFKNHLQMIAGAMSSMGWVTSCEPKNLISDALNAVPVFAKYVEEKEGPEHAALVKSLKALLRTLRAYADKYHNAGLAWNTWNAQAQTSLAKKAVDASGVSGSIDTERYKYRAAEILGDYDQLLRDKVVPFVQTAYALGGDMVEIADSVQKAFKAQRDMLEEVTASRRPSDEDLEDMLEETSEVLAELAEWEEAEGPRASHLKLVANGMAALAWVSLEVPVTYVTEVVNSLPVFSDKILKEAAQRRKDAKKEQQEGEDEKDLDTELVTTFREAMRGLLAYVKQYHSQGLQWNPNGRKAGSS